MSFQSSAPQIIRIKRKRDDAPLESLYIESGTPQGKRRATADTYMFKIVPPEPKVPQIPTQLDGVPMVRATAPGEEKRNPLALRREPATPKSIPSPSTPQQSRTAPRRFQLSRQNTPPLVPNSSSRKRKATVAVFVEERIRAVRVAPAKVIVANEQTQRTLTTQDAPAISQEQGHGPKLKRPSARSRRNLLNGGQPVAADDTAPKYDPEFSSKMAAWAEETEKAEQSTTLNISKSSATEPVIRGEDVDLEMNDVEAEGDYVYDTYHRHFVSANSAASLDATTSIGHLVITEEDQELWQTYIDDDEDEKEFDTDDEDSNAEDYYGADYPEDEVDEDDEYDRDAYKYRRGASDDEEWNGDLAVEDVVSTAWSDGEDNGRDFSGGVTPIVAGDKMVE